MTDIKPMVLKWPVDSCYRVVSLFGWRVHPITQLKTYHNGVDIACPEGTPIACPLPGKVNTRWIDEKHGGGRSLKFKGEYLAEDGLVHEVVVGFAHLSAYSDDVNLHPGKQRPQGDIVAFSGGVPGKPGSGKSTGAHLHMTIMYDGVKVNPLDLKWDITPRRLDND